MKEYSIGFRLKFDAIEPEDISGFVACYLEKFDRYEIKVTKTLLSSGKIEALLNVSEEIAKGRYSLHLLKDALSNFTSYEETKGLIKKLQHNVISSKVYLVTHIPESGFEEYLKRVLYISSNLPPQYILLLENVERNSCNSEYLEQIDYLFYLLSNKNIKNVGMCLDIAHLMYGFHKEGTLQYQSLLELERMPYILSNVKEIHIHDYSEIAHMQLKTGLMNLELISDFIRKNKFEVPVIIETTVKQPEKDGLEQIRIMNNILKQH